MKYDSQKLSWKQLISAFKASSWFFSVYKMEFWGFATLYCAFEFDDAEMIRGLSSVSDHWFERFYSAIYNW